MVTINFLGLGPAPGKTFHAHRVFRQRDSRYRYFAIERLNGVFPAGVSAAFSTMGGKPIQYNIQTTGATTMGCWYEPDCAAAFRYAAFVATAAEA